MRDHKTFFKIEIHPKGNWIEWNCSTKILAKNVNFRIILEILIIKKFYVSFLQPPRKSPNLKLRKREIFSLTVSNSITQKAFHCWIQNWSIKFYYLILFVFLANSFFLRDRNYLITTFSVIRKIRIMLKKYPFFFHFHFNF